jgi:hypothetical protein
MPPRNKKSRSKKTPGGYVRLNRYVMRCDAWKALSPHARCLYLVLLDRHRDYGRGKNNNGKIALSHREAMSGSGCSDRGIRKGFRDLIAKGFISIMKDSAFNMKAALAREYALTEYPIGDSLATKDFMRWTPDEEKNTVSNVNTTGVQCEHSKPKNGSHKLRHIPFTASTVNTDDRDLGVHCGHTYNNHMDSEADPLPSNWLIQ